jgi:YegS/Rv2252/BmrU family lipid kinase
MDAIRAAFEQYPVETKWLETKGQGYATALVRDADISQFDAVIAVGGDGTVFEVLNGIFSHPHASRPALGIIPMGTGNAFARDLDLFPENWKDAVSRICNGCFKQVDVGEIESETDTFHFLNIAGLGFATEAGLTARKLKFVGDAAYSLGTLWNVMRLKSYTLNIKLDGHQHCQENVLLEVSNSRFTGTSFLIAPDALIDDGLLDVTLLRKVSRLRLLQLFPTIFKGNHVHFEEIETYRVKEIEVSAPAGMLLTVDGEFRGKTPVRIRCLPGALKLLV